MSYIEKFKSSTKKKTTTDELRCATSSKTRNFYENNQQMMATLRRINHTSRQFCYRRITAYNDDYMPKAPDRRRCCSLTLLDGMFGFCFCICVLIFCSFFVFPNLTLLSLSLFKYFTNNTSVEET